MLPQKLLINVCVDTFAGTNENNGTFLAVTAHHTQGYLLQRSPRFGREVDAGVHVGHREVCQVAAVVAVDSQVPSEDFSSASLIQTG